MQPTMRKPGTTTISRKQGAGKQMILKKPQRGPGVAELERIRLQEEQEQRLLYHHQHQQDSAPYHLHFKQKNIPAPQDAEELELPSFQSMFVKTQQQRMNPSYEKQYLRCNLDLNNTQGDYELAYNAKMNPRTKMISSRDNSTFGFETSTRDGFLKLGLPTIAEDWNHGGMQTRILERCNEHTMSPGMGVGYHALYGQMVKEKKPNIDLELKLSLPSFGYH